jgi:hypothetical protein
MTLALLHAEVVLRNVADQNLDKESLASYLKSQNTLLRLIASLLFNLSENPSTMRKMVNKDIVTSLFALLDRRNADLLVLSLTFLRKITMVPIHWSAIPFEQIALTVAHHVFRWAQVATAEGRQRRIGVLREGIELLYAFSFHSEAIPVIKRPEIFEPMSTLVDFPELRPQLVRIFYKCSIGEGTDDVFRNEKLLNMLILSTTIVCDERMIALIVLSKLSLDKECSLMIARSPLFTTDNIKSMFLHATTAFNDDGRILLALLRNVADNQADLIRGFDAEIIAACEQNSEKVEILIDVLAIANRSRMTSDRAKLISGQLPFLKLILALLADERGHPQVHLECVMFVGSLVLYAAAAQVLGGLGIVERLARVFAWHCDNLDIQAQCMFAFCRLISHAQTRVALLARTEIIDAALRLSTARNAVMNQIANAVIEAIFVFDKDAAERLKLPRFDHFNHEWLAAMLKQS